MNGKLRFFAAIALGSLAPAVAWADASNAEVNLEEQLNALNLPSNQAPAGVSSERLYSVQSRHESLSSRFELSLGAGRNFTSDAALVSNEAEAALRFHLSDTWHLVAGGSYVTNSLSSSGQKFIESEGRVPDVAYAKSKLSLSLGHHLFYGKFRLSADSTLYFNHYLQLGVGTVSQSQGSSTGIVPETGFVFWLGKGFTARFSIKDWIYTEKRLFSSSSTHNFVGGLQLGFLFGSGTRATQLGAL